MWAEFSKTVNFLDLYKICNALPREWQNIIQKDLKSPSQKSIGDKIANQLKCTKIIYDAINELKLDTGLNRNKWEINLNTEISDIVWQNQFNRVKKLTLSTKLRFFQFRILHRYLITNTRVVMWDKNASQLCTFCRLEPRNNYAFTSQM